MMLEEFFEKYGDDEQMMSQVLAASKDENTLLEFLGSHGVAVVPTSARKRELCDEELSGVAGGYYRSSVRDCQEACERLTNKQIVGACKEACKRMPNSGY